MRFKKIYVEITNKCNLNCSFCNNNKRDKNFMSVEQFKYIVDQIKPYTNYVYLHVKGEPLLHPNFGDILKICEDNNILVNITTNGVLLKERKKELLESKSIRQINVSLHSENKISTYFEDIFSLCKILSRKMFVSYRLWTLINNKLDEKSTKIVDKISLNYNLSQEVVEKIKTKPSTKIDFHTFVNKDNLFEWPTLDKKKETHNFCYGLTAHIAILVDGTVVPCCLDGEGIINLGNIFKEPLDEILEKDRTKNIITNFKNNKCCEELCSKCSFKNRFNNK